jgi:hypothetical protein
MSWLFSRALVEASLGDTSSDGEPSAPSSGSPTQLAYLPPDRMTAFSRPSRSGMTFRPLTADLGEAVLTSYLEAFPARTSVWRGGGQESTAPAAECGDTWRGSLARFDPVTSSWRTAQPSLLEDLGESSVIWPRSGMTAGGQCWELPTLERRTSGIGSGLWATPSATDGQRGGTITENMTGVSLAQMVNTPSRWPTPTVCGNYNRKGASATSGDGLATAVLKWPTPIASDSRGSSGRPKSGKQTQLVDAVRFATPLSRDWRSGKTSQATAEKNSRPLSEQIGGSLNPTWVEWLMGWPLGWTDLKPLETGKSPSAPQQPGDCFPWMQTAHPVVF